MARGIIVATRLMKTKETKSLSRSLIDDHDHHQQRDDRDQLLTSARRSFISRKR
jgi:hypothetical protein